MNNKISIGIFTQIRESLLKRIDESKYLPLGKCPICGYIIKRIEVPLGSNNCIKTDRGIQVRCPTCDSWKELTFSC